LGGQVVREHVDARDGFDVQEGRIQGGWTVWEYEYDHAKNNLKWEEYLERERLARSIDERFLHFAASARFASREKDWPLWSE
jgi:hypothetical protein